MDDWFSEDSARGEPAGLSVVPDTAIEAGLDDDWFTAAEPSQLPDLPVAAAAPKPPARRRFPAMGLALVAGCVVLCAAVVAGLALLVTHILPESDAARAQTPPLPSAELTSAVVTTLASAWCAGMAGGEPITRSSADPGAATIAALETAYYQDRDAAAVRRFVTPDARVGSVEEISAGIATVPAGTTHCVLARPVAEGLYAVDLFARAPGGALEHYRQTITTITAPASETGALVTGIVARQDN